jgi:hypothetical protein
MIAAGSACANLTRMHPSRVVWSFVVVLGAAVAALAATKAAAPAAPSVEAAPRYQARFAGKAPALAFDGDGTLHVAYAAAADDEAADQVLVRAFGVELSAAVAVSGPIALEAEGEVGPELASLGGGALATVYAVALPGRWVSELRLQRSGDGGRSWQPPQRVHDDGKSASHSYADVVANRRGEPVVSWLDNRSGHQGARAAVFGAPEAHANVSVDDVTCECCRTSMLAAADGTIWLAYRDLAEGDVRNVAYALSRDDGSSFTRKGDIADDRWSISGCPDSGPRLAQAPDGTVWAAWFNGERRAIEVAPARGSRFTAPQVVAAAGGEVTMVNHPEIGTLPDGRLVLFYETAGGGRAIAMRVGDPGGKRWQPPVVLARDASRPRWARSGDRAVLAYSSHAGDRHQVVLVDGRDLPLPR